ncbi:MAG: secretin N-terminal domain-containing protein [Pirellulales bacterium]
MMHSRIYLFCFYTFLVYFLGISPLSAQTPDLTRLAHPEVAERLSLSDEQRASIQKLLQQRAEALVAAADVAAKNQVKKDFDTKLLGTLTPEQQTRWKEDKSPQKLMFQFRDMKWEDVLQWFANQQDLTLVMDRIPPGTFTYSDIRSYTPSEAIDLLNSVLMTRNFALIRRDKMLVVSELSDALPLELVPQITLEQIPTRGRFELVTVTFPLAGRPIDAVLQEVKPYLSSYGRVVPLAQGGKVMVVEMAGKMATINELIAAVPLPKPAPQPEKPTPPPQPVFASYALGNLDPIKALETIRKLIPSEQITSDPKTGILSAFVVPTQQTAIQAAIEQMKTSAEALPNFGTQVFPFTGITADELKKQVATIIPRASVVASTDRLFVSGSKEDLQTIQQALAAMDIFPVGTSKSAKAFQVDVASITPLETALKSFLPKSSVIGNPKTGSLVVRGSEEDLRIASEILDIWKLSSTQNQLQLKAFPLERKADATWLTSVQKVVPNANAWLGDDGKQLMVLASAQDVLQLEAVLQPLQSLLPKVDHRILKFYSLTKAQLQRRVNLSDLPPQLSTMKITDGVNKQELLAWGTEEQHAAFAAHLASLDQPTPTSPLTTPKVYTLESQETSLIQTILTAEFPEAKLSIDTEGTRLTAIADEATHTLLATRIDTFNQQLPKKVAPRLESYSVKGMTATVLQTTLAPLLTKARVNLDAEHNRLLVSADARTHQEIRELVDSLSEKTGVDQQKIVVAYPIENALPSQLKLALDQLGLPVQTLADDKLKKVIVTGTLEAHAVLQSTIAQIDRPTGNATKPEIRSFDAKKIQGASLLPTLQKMWPDMVLSIDTSSNRIIATGQPKDLDELQVAIDRILSSPDGKPQMAKAYSVPAGEMTTLSTILGQIAPQSLISSDPVSRTVTVWGNEEQQARIEEALKQLSSTAQSIKVPATYFVKPAQALAVQTALQSLFPGLSVTSLPTTGQVIAVGSTEQQDKIRQVIEMLTSGPNDQEKSLKVFRVEADVTEMTAFIAGLQSVLPSHIRLEASPTSPAIIAVGTTDDLQLVSKKVEELQRELLNKEATTVVVYPLSHGSPASGIALLTPLVPKATLVQDPTTRTIAATAKAAEHRKIAEFLRAFDVPKKPVTYYAKPTQLTTITTSLRTLFPAIELTSDATTGQLIVLATEDQQKRIAEILEMLVSGSASQDRRVQVYSLDVERVDFASIQTALQSLLPSQIRMEYNPKSGTILAIGTQEELGVVSQKIAELQQQIPPLEQPQTVVYPIKYANVSSAYSLLASTFPRVTLVQDPVSRTLTASGKSADHGKIREFLDSYDRPRLPMTFQLKPSMVTSVQTSIKTLFPTVDVTADTVSGQLIVVATDDLRDSIHRVLDMLASGGSDEERIIRVLRIDPDRVDFANLSTTLQSNVPPTVKVEANSKNNTLILFGMPDDVAQVERKIQSLQEQLPPPDAILSQVYPLQYATPASALTILQSLTPKATIVQDPVSKTIAASAKAVDHEKIREFLKAFDVPRKTALETRVYRLRQNSARGLAVVLTELMPDAVLYGSREEGVLIATASREQHTRIEAIVKDYDGNDQSMETRVFAMQHGTAASLRAALTGFSPKTTVTSDTSSNSLIVSAPRDDMARIEAIVKDIETGGDHAKITRYYPLMTAEPLPLARALESSFPKAKFAADSTSGGVFATASSDEHVEIAKVIEEVNEQPSKLPSLRAFVLQHANPESVALALTNAFGRRSTAGVTPHRESRSVFVVGNRQELETAADLVRQLDVAKSADDTRRLRAFPLGTADGKSMVAAIESIFKESLRPVDVKYDSILEQLIVIGDAAQLKQVEETMLQFAPPQRTLEMLQLQNTDPYSFKSAAESLFSDEPYTRTPSITVDANLQQVVIRATPEQHEQLRKLLQQMGESGLGASKSGESNTNRKVRFIPVQLRSEELLEEVQRLWPAIRSNPLQIIQPGKEPAMRPGNTSNSQTPTSQPRQTEERYVSTVFPAEFQPPGAPLIVIPSNEQWTIASEDVQALEQFEKMIDSILHPRVEPIANAGQFSIYILKHSDAKQMEKLLNDLFRSGDGNRRSATSPSSWTDAYQRIKIIADPRINGLVIGGNKADRRIIEELLGVFDSREWIDRLQQIEPTMVVLQYASAKSISTIVQDVYKSQLAAGAGRDPMEIPEGVSTEVATLLQQLNAQASGPLLTASIDESSNAIILRGARELVREVEGFIQRLDQQAESSPSRRVQVLRLESTNTKNLEKALKILMAK